MNGDSASTIAKLNLKLDESAKPIPRTRRSGPLPLLLRPQVPRDLRGQRQRLPEGATLPVAQSQEQVEFDDIYNTFDTATRENSRRVLQGFGDAFAARGVSLNEAIGALNPLFENLRPVSAALADPTTQLERFFPELADAARIVAPSPSTTPSSSPTARSPSARSPPIPTPSRHDLRGPPVLEAGLRSCRCSGRSWPTSPSSPACSAPGSATARRCRTNQAVSSARRCCRAPCR